MKMATRKGKAENTTPFLWQSSLVLIIDSTTWRKAWLWSGSILYLVVLTITWWGGARLHRDIGLMAFVGPTELRSAPWGDLLMIHAQPPGFSALLKFADAFGRHSETILLTVLISAAVAGIWMTSDITYRLTGQVHWGVMAGLFAGAAPGTTFYSLWVFYTIPTAFLLTASVWGMVRAAHSGSVVALTTSVVAISVVALVRASVVWILVLVWLAVNARIIRDVLRQTNSARAILSLVIGLTALGGLAAVQGHAFATFKSITLSSWGSENIAKAIRTTMSDDEVFKLAGNDSCLVAVLQTGVLRPVDEYPPCARAVQFEGSSQSELLTKEYWDHGSANMNHIQRLGVAEEWQAFVIAAVRDDPTRIIRVLLPSFRHHERGTILRLLWPSSWFWVLRGNVSTTGLSGTFWILGFAWIPAAMILLVLFGLVKRKTLWNEDNSTRWIFTSASLATLSLITVYLLFESGENERFRAEVDWLLIALGVAVLGQLVKRRKVGLALKERRL